MRGDAHVRFWESAGVKFPRATQLSVKEAVVQDVVVGVVQMNALCGQTGRNVERHRVLARRAARRGAEWVCFPELSLTGHYVDKKAWACAEPVPGGPAYQAVEDLAQELGVVISAGIGERRGNVVLNTQFLVGPDGFIGKYSKTHASGDEYFYFGMGGEFPVWDLGKAKVGILICYDIAFPEVARILALEGAEVILAPHAGRCGQTTPRQERKRVLSQLEFFERMGWARSTDNGVFMVMSNQAGDAGGPVGLDAVHGGGIVITDPRGEVLVATLPAQRFVESHARSCHPLQTRRPAIYGRLGET